MHQRSASSPSFTETVVRYRFRLMRVLISIPLLLGIFAGTGLALKPDREYPATPSDYGIVFREVEIVTADSITVAGWFFPAQDTAGIVNALVGRMPLPPSYKGEARTYQTLDDEKKATIVICDGDAGNMAYQILYAYHLFTQGFNVLLFDWRGFGASDDWPMNPDQLCYTEFLWDFEAALEYVKQQPEVDSTRIGVFGFSTGAYLSFAMASKSDNVAAYAGRALMTSFAEVAPILKALAPERPLLLPDDYPKNLQPIVVAESITIPVFLVVGEDDDRTPPEMSRRIFAKLQGPKELWIVENAGHGGGKAPEYVNYPEFFNRLAAFFIEHL